MHQNQNKHTNNTHQPVLLQEVLQYLHPQKGDRYLDLTAGYGGHAAEVFNVTGKAKTSVLVDRDEHAISFLRERFSADAPQLIHDDFYTAAQKLKQQQETFDCILADIGVSSPHLDKASRGFSLRADGPLDMRMDQRQELTAETIVNTYPEEDLYKIIRTYGEEPKARFITRAIIANRPINSTIVLADIVKSAWRGKSKHHPASRTFQALRIAVNDELSLLQSSLPVWLELLKPGGRIAVISFHSLEDRIVKRAFSERGGDRYDADVRILTKQPVVATADELVFNPRARSAKLRAAVKIKINTKP